MLRDRLMSFYQDSVRDCQLSILCDMPRGDALLDYGCADGELTRRFAAQAGATKVFGVEVVDRLISAAQGRGVEIIEVQGGRMLLPDACVDVVTANQVIEHLSDTDSFVREVHRVLRPGGTFMVSTNNLASWHNIVALLVGAQPFPSDVSNNPAVGKLVRLFEDESGAWASMSHLRVFSYRALTEMMETYRFVIQRVQGVGYYPLPSKVANRLAMRYPRHAAYLTLRCLKPAG